LGSTSEGLPQFKDRYEEFLSLGGSKENLRSGWGFLALDIEDSEFWNIGIAEVRSLLESLKTYGEI
jgi:oligoendopeptidase F